MEYHHLKLNTHAVLPYDGRLKYFTSYLQQLEMESNGKSTQRNGHKVEHNTCPIVWGEVGPNAQHAFYQLLHQGTHSVSCDFIAPIKRYNANHFTYAKTADTLIDQHLLALSNCLAQSRLLAFGNQVLNPEELEQLPAYKQYEGNQPSTTMLLKELSPRTMGKLIALYEHKVFVQSVIWDINPFDQWGVEKAKEIANELLPILNGQTAEVTHLDASTQGLIEFLLEKQMAKILVTGGAGYIGSHTCVELLQAHHDVVVLDNLSNSSREALVRVEALAGKSLEFVEGDIRDSQMLDQVFKQFQIDAVIHFAGLKAVGESQQIPLTYFDNNIAGSIHLVDAMARAGVFKLVFSSSATVYDEANSSPLNEDMPTGMPSNNYGYTKLIVEQMLQKLALADARWSIALLRYFNPVGHTQVAVLVKIRRGFQTI